MVGQRLVLPEDCRLLGLDIDDTITAHPRAFAEMTREAADRNVPVVVITSRSEAGRPETIVQLRELGIRYGQMHFLPAMSFAEQHCPHRELDWYQRYLWFKVHFAQQEGVTHFYDDDPKVEALFLRYAPEIVFNQV